MVRRCITHSLAGGGSHNLGYHALRWEMILHGNSGKMGKYAVLSVLPDKIARFPYEYYDTSYTSLELPALPMCRSDISVHNILRTDQVLNICKIHIRCRICNIWHILQTVHIDTLYVQQSRALLDTLWIHASNNNRSHIVLYSTLLIGHTLHMDRMLTSSFPLAYVPTICAQEIAGVQSPGYGVYQLSRDIWKRFSAQDR